jgi:aminoglycoside 9-adenylyltransferase
MNGVRARMGSAFRPMGDSVEKQLPQEATQAFSIVQEVLGNTVVGVYLFGSAVVGGLRPNSDVDVLVVVNERLSEKTRKNLVARLMRVSGRVTDNNSGRPLELTVLHFSDVVPWRYPPRSELVYGEWLRKKFEENRIPKPEPDPDLVIVLTKVRESGIPMFGPSARELLDPVPMEYLRLAIAESLPNLIDGLKGDERNVLLTLARMWMTASIGEIAPKNVAAEWALERLPKEHRRLLDLARRAYLGECKDNWEEREAEAIALVNYMKQSIKSCLYSPSSGEGRP